jgi:hypothetical protein
MPGKVDAFLNRQSIRVGDSDEPRSMTVSGTRLRQTEWGLRRPQEAVCLTKQPVPHLVEQKTSFQMLNTCSTFALTLDFVVFFL